MGHVPAQSRRARSRPADRRRSGRRCSPRSGPTRTCSSTTAASAGGSRRCSTATGGARAGLQPDVHAARHAGHALRRRARHGRRSAPARAQLRAHADAMVERAAWRLHQERQAGGAGDQRRAVRLRARQRRDPAPRSEFAAELDRAHHPHAQGGAGDRLGRLHGDRRPATRPCWSCATTGATTRCCSCTISTASRARSRSRSASRATSRHGELLVNLLSEDHSQADEDGRHRLVHRAYGYRWYRVGGLDYLLRRSEIDDASGARRRRVGRASRGRGRRVNRRRGAASAKSRR